MRKQSNRTVRSGRTFTRHCTAALCVAAITAGASAGLTGVDTDLMDQYLIIGTGNDDNAKALDASDSDLGADIVVLSESTIDNVGANLDDVFLNNAGMQWVNVNDTANDAQDYLPGAGAVHEGVSWTGDVALTSPNASFNASNSEFYAQRGIDAQSAGPADSVSNTEYFSNGVGDGIDTTGNGLSMPGSGVNGSVDLSALRSQVNDWEAYVTSLAPEATINSSINNQDYLEFNVDAWDTNMDGIAVVDVDVSGDWSISNSNVVFESEKGTFAIIRILNGSNLDLSQSTLMLGDGVFGNDDAGSISDLIEALGVVIVVANEYNDGEGGTNSGEARDSSDQVFSFDNMVVNGVGFHDLIEFSDEGDDGFFDDGLTELSMQNVQGCTHIISPKVSLSNVRLEHCAFPEMTVIPTPAALPAGLALIGLAMARRRH